METALEKWIVTSVSVVILASLVATISWTVVIGWDIAASFQDNVIKYYSEAGLSIMVDANNIDDVDAVNLYKMMEVNRNIITDYTIRNLDGTYVFDTRTLLNRPADRFSVVIRGDSSTGFEVIVTQVLVERSW